MTTPKRRNKISFLWYFVCDLNAIIAFKWFLVIEREIFFIFHYKKEVILRVIRGKARTFARNKNDEILIALNVIEVNRSEINKNIWQEKQRKNWRQRRNFDSSKKTKYRQTMNRAVMTRRSSEVDEANEIDGGATPSTGNITGKFTFRFCFSLSGNNFRFYLILSIHRCLATG